jgi:hypothetical protein
MGSHQQLYMRLLLRTPIILKVCFGVKPLESTTIVYQTPQKAGEHIFMVLANCIKSAS